MEVAIKKVPVHKITPGFGFSYPLRDQAPEVFEALSDKEIDASLRRTKVIRKNQGEVTGGVLVVTGTTQQGVEACLKRVAQHVVEELEDLKRIPPKVTRDKTSEAGPCLFCTANSRLVWGIAGARINKIRICDNCLHSVTEQMKGLK